MRVLNNSRLMLGFVFLLLFIEIAYPSDQVIVEFLYLDPRNDPSYCNACTPWVELYYDFLAKNDTMNVIGRYYEGEVVFEWIDITFDEG